MKKSLLFFVFLAGLMATQVTNAMDKSDTKKACKFHVIQNFRNSDIKLPDPKDIQEISDISVKLPKSMSISDKKKFKELAADLFKTLRGIGDHKEVTNLSPGNRKSTFRLLLMAFPRKLNDTNIPYEQVIMTIKFKNQDDFVCSFKPDDADQSFVKRADRRLSYIVPLAAVAVICWIGSCYLNVSVSLK